MVTNAQLFYHREWIQLHPLEKKARPCSKPIPREEPCTLPMPTLTKLTPHHNFIKIPVSHKIPSHSTASDKTWGTHHSIVAWNCWLWTHFG